MHRPAERVAMQWAVGVPLMLLQLALQESIDTAAESERVMLSWTIFAAMLVLCAALTCAAYSIYHESTAHALAFFLLAILPILNLGVAIQETVYSELNTTKSRMT